MSIDYNITAIKEGQPTPEINFLADESRALPIDIGKLIRGCAFGPVEAVDPYDWRAPEDTHKKTESFFHDQKAAVSAVITRHACARMYSGSISDTKFWVGNNCDTCLTCIQDVACTAISIIKDDQIIRTDPDLWWGCGFCVEACPSQAVGDWRN